LGKIGLISDTHGSLHPEVFEAFAGVELILHAGDVDSPVVLSDLEVLAPVLAVRGNMDRSLSLTALPTFRLVHWAGRSIALIHNLDRLGEELTARRLQEEEIHVVVFGHTHAQACWREDGCMYVNPGTAKANAVRPGAALLWVGEEGVSVQHLRFKR
jgi:putative phosphoesterase